MTFEKQIEGLPISWVQQGWRLQPDDEFDSGWRRQSPANRWDYEAIEVDGAYLDIARPVVEPANRPRVYAHAGWGEGLAPTPEMVKVWKWWWYLPAMGTFLRAVEVIETPEGLKFQCVDIPAKPITQARGEWRGPVLPPMEAL